MLVALVSDKDVIWVCFPCGERSYHSWGLLRCANWDISDLSEPSQHVQAFPSKTADGSVTHKEGGDLETPLCCLLGFSSKLKEFPGAMGRKKEEAERGESNSYEKLRSRYSKGQKGRKHDFGKSKMQPQRHDSWRLQNCFPRFPPHCFPSLYRGWLCNSQGRRRS